VSPIFPDQPELILTESRTMRDQNADRIDALDKVKVLVTLPDDLHITVDMAATYFEAEKKAVEYHIRNNRDELQADGMRILVGEALKGMKGRVAQTESDSVSPIGANSRSLTVLPRRAVLRLAMLIRDSKVAKDIRTYLLNVEELATPEIRSEAADAVALAEARMRVLKVAEGIVDAAWLETKARMVAARALGEEPDLDPLDVPLYVPDFLAGKGLKRKQVESVQSWFGRRAAALFEAEHGEKPGKRQSDLPNGSVRETYAWTARHLPLFEETWDRYYADQFPVQGEFGGES
jgi:hypothetical protein